VILFEIRPEKCIIIQKYVRKNVGDENEEAGNELFEKLEREKE